MHNIPSQCIFRADHGTVEADLFRDKILKDKNRFAPKSQSQLTENFFKAESGVIMTTDLKIAETIADNRAVGCTLQVTYRAFFYYTV